MRRLGMVIAVIALAGGCCFLDKMKLKHAPVAQPATFSEYHQEGWEWERVNRVLVLPFLNESEIPQPQVADKVRDAFRSELQQMGRFEVVPASPDDQAVLAAQVHRGGRFDEATMLALARATSSDVIVHGVITQYSPYPRPRMGIVLQAVSPEQGKVIASVDGVWDTTDNTAAERGNAYYRQRIRPRLPVVRNNYIIGDDRFAEEMWRDSPALFHRWVFHEASLALLGYPVPGVVSSGMNSQGVTGVSDSVNLKQNCAPVLQPTQSGNVK